MTFPSFTFYFGKVFMYYISAPLLICISSISILLITFKVELTVLSSKPLLYTALKFFNKAFQNLTQILVRAVYSRLWDEHSSRVAATGLIYFSSISLLSGSLCIRPLQNLIQTMGLFIARWYI